MKAIKYMTAALAISMGCVTAAQAHPFIGVGIVGGPVFPVASSGQSAPPLPVYPRATDSGPAPLPLDAPPPVYVQPAVGNIDAVVREAEGASAANAM
ncbi:MULTISPECIES: hypothetical protein [unclassified Caballeronia]|uniref:hypothetical protein n=1 Tax=unclassified Caballeronia TaxID=2646786 RepID=UPI00286173EA|nr:MULTISPECIES: hypothetical protein [unclassified Caballeronia]MDR5740909.1 hypothetical protein [Caballeronia sp. LZ016]MDR5808570.1 hypothetical protein [Caballeronia sp. LZ019]